jgi:hypothetical protein
MWKEDFCCGVMKNEQLSKSFINHILGDRKLIGERKFFGGGIGVNYDSLEDLSEFNPNNKIQNKLIEQLNMLLKVHPNITDMELRATFDIPGTNKAIAWIYWQSEKSDEGSEIPIDEL